MQLEKMTRDELIDEIKRLSLNQAERQAEGPPKSMDTDLISGVSEDIFRMVFENANNGIVFLATNGTIKDINPKALEIISCDREEIVGKKVEDLSKMFEIDIESLMPAFQETITSKHPTRTEWVITNRMGRQLTVSANPTIVEKKGTILGVCVNLVDITDQEITRVALKESEEKYRKLIENINDVLYIIDIAGVVKYVSPPVENCLGFTPAEITGGKFADLVHEEDRERSQKNFMKIFDGEVVTNEYRIKTKSGQFRWIRTSSKPLVKEGKLTAVHGTMTDITERKLAEEALRESEAKWRSLVENAPDIIINLDTEGNILYYNRIVTGHDSEEVLGSPIYNFIPKEQHEKTRSAINEVLKKGNQVSFETEVLNSEGAILWFSTRLGPIKHEDKIVGLVQISTDITDRKEMEAALEESELKSRSIIDSIPLGIHIYRLENDGKLVFTGANPAADRILGIDNSKFIGKTIEDAFPASVETEIPERYREAAGNGTPWHNDQVIYEEGKISGAFLVDAFQTSPSMMVASFLDITERRKTEEALQESELKYRSLFENANDAIMLIEPETQKIVDCNQKTSTMTGFPVEELKNMKVWELHPEGERDALAEKFKMVIEKGSFEGFTDLHHLRKDGRIIDIEINATMIQVNDQQLNLSVIRDVTERKEAEKALVQSEERYRKISELISDFVYAIRVEPDGTQVSEWSTDTLSRIIGTDHDDLLKNGGWEKIIHPEDLPIVMKRQENLAAGKSDVAEYRVLEKDGNIIWVRDYGYPIFNEAQKRIVKIYGAAQNITERKEAEEALRQSEEKFRELAELLPQTVFEIDIEGNLTYSNQHGFENTKYTQADIDNGLNAVHLFVPEDRKRIQVNLKKVLIGEKFQDNEYTALRKDGSTYPVIIFSKPIVRDGKTVGVRGIAVDITDRKYAEEALKRSEEQLRLITDNTSDFITITDRTGKFIYVSPSQKRLGYDSETLLGSMGIEFIHPDDLPGLIEDLNEFYDPEGLDNVEKSSEKAKNRNQNIKEANRLKGMGSSKIVEYRVLDVWGNYHTIEDTVNPIFDTERNIDMLVHVSKDITEKKQAEISIRESEEKFRLFFENEPEYCYMVSPEGLILDINKSALTTLGYLKDELVGQPMNKIYAPDCQTKADEMFKIWTKKGRLENEELDIITKTGEKRTVLLSSEAMRDSEGKILHSISVQRDITERKYAQEALNYRLKFEELVSTISTHFINLKAEEIDEGINDALEQVGKFSEVDRSYVILFIEDGKKLSNTHEWCAEGIESQMEQLEILEIDMFKWAVDRLIKNELLNIPDVIKLPESSGMFKESLIEGDIRSLLSVPIVIGGNVFGFIGFDSVKRKREWSDDMIAMIRIVSDIIANALERKEADEELKKSEAKYRTLVRNIPDVLWTSDRDGNTLYISNKVKMVYGYTADEIYGSGNELWFGRIHPDDRERVEKVFNDLFDKGIQLNIEYRIKHKNGEWIWLQDRSTGTYERDGVFYADGIFSDITARKLAEEENQNFFDLSSDILCIIDIEKNQLKKINPAFVNKTGFTEEELYSKPMAEFIQPQDLGKLMTEFERAIASKETQTIYAEIRLLCKNGDHIWLGLNANLLPQEGMIYVVARDITDQKLKELEIKRRLMKYRLDDGNIYLSKERAPMESIEAFSDLLNVGHEGVVFSRKSESDLKFVIPKDFKYFWLAESNKYFAVKPKVGSIINELEKMPGKVAILFDRMDYLVFKNGVQDTISFAQDLKELMYLKDSIAIVSIDPDTLKNEDLRMLEKECLELEPLHKTMLSQELFDILMYILERNSKKINPTYNTIVEDLKMSRPTARKRLTKLMDLGYLIETKKGREKIFELTEKSLNILA